MGKSIELAKILRKRRVNIACVQETRWVGSSAKDVDGYKLWYSGVERGKNGVGILVDRELRGSVLEVRRVNDRLMVIKLVVDEIVHQVPPTEKLFIGGDFNGHIGATAGGYGEVHRGFGFGERNGGGTMLLDFAKSFGLRRLRLTISGGVTAGCVILSESLATQHRLLVLDVGIRLKRRKRTARGPPRIRWGAFIKDKAQELEWRLSAMGAWRSSGDANTMW
uniref:Uncharacterized protein LOC104217624 n=1 Tax=Nicotiana sylvestris TaxID=4096 RepID=A0A1U7VIQ5_NICSY|nr:PREDICTED: uncharacterized protein LOC104217624 [Nicotiana sylvestris]